jgi:hypothetical protein
MTTSHIFIQHASGQVTNSRLCDFLKSLDEIREYRQLVKNQHGDLENLNLFEDEGFEIGRLFTWSSDSPFPHNVLAVRKSKQPWYVKLPIWKSPRYHIMEPRITRFARLPDRVLYYPSTNRLKTPRDLSKRNRKEIICNYHRAIDEGLIENHFHSHRINLVKELIRLGYGAVFICSIDSCRNFQNVSRSIIFNTNILDTVFEMGTCLILVNNMGDVVIVCSPLTYFEQNIVNDIYNNFHNQLGMEPRILRIYDDSEPWK